MSVHFEATIDELVDVQIRLLARSGETRKWQLEWRITLAAFAGLIEYMIIPDRWEIRLGVAVLIAGAVFTTYPSYQRRGTEKRLKRYFIEQYGSDEPFTVTVDLSQEGMR